MIARAKTNGPLRPMLRLARTFTRSIPEPGGTEDRAYVVVGDHDLRLTFLRVNTGWALTRRDNGDVWGKDTNQGSAL